MIEHFTYEHFCLHELLCTEENLRFCSENFWRESFPVYMVSWLNRLRIDMYTEILAKCVHIFHKFFYLLLLNSLGTHERILDQFDQFLEIKRMTNWLLINKTQIKKSKWSEDDSKLIFRSLTPFTNTILSKNEIMEEQVRDTFLI